MAFTDNRTQHLNLPLPHANNALETDVQRLVEAIAGLDNAAHALSGAITDATTPLSERLTSAELSISGNTQSISALQAMKGAANGLATLDADAKLKAEQIPGLNASAISAGTLPVKRGGSGLAAVTAGSYLKGNGEDALVPRTPAQVLVDIGAMPKAGGEMTGSLSVTGDITATGDVRGYSDRRLKEAIEPIRNALAKVRQLNGVTYRMQGEDDTRVGLIAQDVQAVMPEAVREVDGYLTLGYGNLVGLLCEAIKELDDKVSELLENAA